MNAEISPISRDLRLRIAAYAGMLAAYLAAVKNDPLTPFQLGFFFVAAAWSLGFEHRFRRPFFSPPIKIALIVLGSFIFVLFISGFARGGTDDFANSIARFLFWNAIVFVLSRNKSEYDLWTLAIIELSLFMISGAFVQPALFVPLLLLSLGSLLYAFQRSALLKCGAAGEAERGGLGLMAAMLAFAVEIAAVVFLVFPRSSFRGDPRPADAAPLPKLPEGAPVASGGGRIGVPRHPEFLDLTNFEKLKQDPREVLRARVRDLNERPVAPERTQFLRGAVLDTYEDGRWRARFQRLPRRDADDGRIDHWTQLEAKPPPGRPQIRTRIQTVALSGDLSFAPPDPVRVALSEARYDPAGILFFPVVPAGLIDYYVDSALMPADIPKVQKLPDPPANWLQLPPGLPLLRETARSVVEKAGPGVHSRAAALEQYLRRNGFRYRLDPFVPGPGKDAVEHFLERKEGYCTHYATALALLCRAAGIPARVATGFQLHSADEAGWFHVRNSDAHAWVEVWFGPEHGWRAYDATPADSRLPENLPIGESVASTEKRRLEEAAREPVKRWDQYIVEFDPKTQGEAVGRAFAAILQALEAAGRALVTPAVLGTAAGLLAVAGLAYALLPGRSRRRLRQLMGGFRDSTRIDFYRDFLWALARRGIRKPPSSTAREFARQLRVTLPGDAAAVDFVTDRFYEACYRSTPPSTDDLRKIEGIVAGLLKPPPPQSR
jgi:transglutaminase-like putative cysteine protease